jgi:hypothetical protein
VDLSLKREMESERVPLDCCDLRRFVVGVYFFAFSKDLIYYTIETHIYKHSGGIDIFFFFIHLQTTHLTVVI